MLSKLTLPSGSSARGADMGRPSLYPEDRNAPIKLQMERLRWVDGDYDQRGAYWGGNAGKSYGEYTHIYCAFVGDGVSLDHPSIRIFVRAKDRTDAKKQIRQQLPKARFYN